MRRQKTMFVAAFLLCIVGVSCFDCVNNQTCVPSNEVECFLPAKYLNTSDVVHINLSVDKKLTISLLDLPGYSVCSWVRDKDPAITIHNCSMVTSPLSETDSGEYTLTCEAGNATTFSKTVTLRVLKRPTKPQLLLIRANERMRSPHLKCTSEGSPKPSIGWSINNKGKNRSGETVSTSEYHDRGVMCCASNAEGQECTQLYDYDMDEDFMKNDEVYDVTVSPGESLLLRCRMKRIKRYTAWARNGNELDPSSLLCGKETEMCIKNDEHYGSMMTYLFIKSARAEHAGRYTCRNPTNSKTKSVDIQVKGEDFLSAELDETKNMTAQNATSSCLQAYVSYHPVLQHCSWEAPDKHMTKCIRDQWVTKHRTVKLCDQLQSGVYKLHLRAGSKTETKNITVCVVDTPNFKYMINQDNHTITVETMSFVPANYTWKLCPLSNDSCESDSSWTMFEKGRQLGSDGFCNKTIKSSVNLDQVPGQQLKFCINNSFGSWCKYPIYPPFTIQAVKGDVTSDKKLMMMLKIGILILLLGVTFLAVVLMYFVKKRKPQYQPQLQMIQMVGPNDNDYIYINFKDFEYDQKWEFPRENLELGQELGSGAFGMVVQAIAHGISKPGVSQKVAVKMLKEKHQLVDKEALMSELKMLTHIGHHDNIVNLLGACTESGPIYLIFQYCCYGDLLNYLKKNSDRYHKSVTDAFNRDRFSSLYHNLQHKEITSERLATVDNYVPMRGSTNRGQEDIALLLLSPYEGDGYIEICENPDEQTEELQALTFDDLLSFAFQVAEGMEFLSSKNCIHRDLAARNVLVTKGRQVKIGDFGLARDIDNDSNYVVRGNVRLPVKWMAPESIFQGVYTNKSDVWAYGILLWEIFSLGVTPYPGVKVDHVFYSMIERGFKMECPYYANESVYGMMCHCWALDPYNRPSFSKLVSFISNQLTDREEELYHNKLDQTCIYQNASVISDSSALAQDQNETQATNDCQAYTTEESKEGALNSEAVAVEELPKPSDTQQ